MTMLKSFLLLFMIFSMGNAGECPANWIKYGIRCYQSFSHSTNWITAERNCQSLGGNLASLHNKLENDFLLSLLPSPSALYWIGGHHAPRAGQWLWSDGTKFFYSNWCPGEPNNSKENCLEINWTSNRCWNNSSCSKAKSYICVKNL